MVNYLIDSLNNYGFLNRDLHSISSDILVAFSIDVDENEVWNWSTFDYLTAEEYNPYWIENYSGGINH